MTAYSFYEQQSGRYSGMAQSYKKKIAVSGLLRLLFFGAFAVSGYFFTLHQTIGLFAISLLSFILFLVFIIQAQQLKERRILAEKLLFISSNELGILRNEPNQMDDGSLFANNRGFAEDLDIFGPRSLFQLLNRCTTSHGKSSLARLLEQPLTDADAIIQRQTAVQIFSTQPEKRQDITAQGLFHGEVEGNLHSMDTWLQPESNLHKKKWLQVLRWIIPVYNTSAFVYYIATGKILFIAIGLIIAWVLTGRYAKYILKQHLLISKKQSVLSQYAGILTRFIAIETGSSTLLHQLNQNATEAHLAIRKLAKLSSFFDQRMNLLVNVFLNSLILYDIQCILELEEWKEKHKLNFPQWLYTVGEIECLNSLAGFSFNYPDFTYPAVHRDAPLLISATQIAHPLIAASRRVPNDFETGKKNKLVLITGSNMSGKTTFLRTLGINLILAQIGAPVCAVQFIFSPMELFTSIRVNDSLQEQTSYFMAELKRLQQIILHLKKNKPALVLIDEILRGTNSEDKTQGSEQFIMQLLQYNCITLFATHDLTLSSLEQSHQGVISNYCFESIIEDDNLHFDYKLHPGVARNKNASFLMKKMGIVEGH